MRYVDEADIVVTAGSGGRGCLSFRREKYIPRGGPDGGDGGDGGSVILRASEGHNTLSQFRYQTQFKASSGEGGRGKNCRGKNGDDLTIEVAVGTVVYDKETGELIGDLTKHGEELIVAQGGFHGLGNARYKSSVNRAPRTTTPGSPGEKRRLHLELKVLADVGLVGLPNAGKSTLISAVSHARPKVASYPFTTLSPELGVVDVSINEQFVMADIPGLIEGASEGAGLGHRFLKHVSRTRILLHCVALSEDGIDESVEAFKTVEAELAAFGHGLMEKERWLVITKSDLLPDEMLAEQVEALKAVLAWTGQVYVISSVAQTGLKELCRGVMNQLGS